MTPSWDDVRSGKVNGHHVVAADASPQKPSPFVLGITEVRAIADARIQELENQLRNIENPLTSREEIHG